MRDFVNALTANDTKNVADWITPNERDTFNGTIDETHSANLTISFHVKNFSIGSVSSSSDHTTIRYQNDVTTCISHPDGNDSTNNTSYHPVQSQSSNQQADTFIYMHRNKTWYVSLSNTSQNN